MLCHPITASRCIWVLTATGLRVITSTRQPHQEQSTPYICSAGHRGQDHLHMCLPAPALRETCRLQWEATGHQTRKQKPGERKRCVFTKSLGRGKFTTHAGGLLQTLDKCSLGISSITELNLKIKGRGKGLRVSLQTSPRHIKR